MATTIERAEGSLWAVTTSLVPADAERVRAIPRSFSGFTVVALPIVEGWRWVGPADGRGVLSGEGLRAVVERTDEPSKEAQEQLAAAINRAVDDTLKVIRDENRNQWGTFL